MNEKIISKSEFAEMVEYDAHLIKVAIEGVYQKPATVKFGSAKALLMLSEKNPKLLYTYFDQIAYFLNHPSNPIRYGALYTIANLVGVDKKDLFLKIYDDYFRFLSEPEVIPASNVAKASATIIMSKSDLSTRIVRDLLKVDDYTYETDICKDIVYGKVIETFHKALNSIDRSMYDELHTFAFSQINNKRSSTAKRADKLIRKLEKFKN